MYNVLYIDLDVGLVYSNRTLEKSNDFVPVIITYHYVRLVGG